jgi:glycosyltransferase involved in cell wall biosynthesis
MRYTLVLRDSMDVPEVVRSLPDYVRKTLQLCAPPKLSSSDPFMTNRNLYKALKKIDVFDQDYDIQANSEVDLYEPRVRDDMDLEPRISPTYQTSTPDRRIELSVVIPSYNNRNYLLSTLNHLLRQNIEAEVFEVIIVDDGSTDGTQSAITGFLRNYENKFNVKYLHFPRTRTRTMGDGQFRAGVARNLGVKNAVGELLVFLDSDILTPPDYLAGLVEAHAEWDLVQTERVYLKRSVCTESIAYEEVDFENDTYIPAGNYWEDFYRCEIPWNQIPFGWKYVCTYGLSVRREVFKSLGWFKKNYIFYGFEDTDFGYRAMKAGLKFYRSDIKCLHLYHETERSEFSNSEYWRYQLLKKSARTLFHNQLDPLIYEHFKRYVDDGLDFNELAFRLKRLLAPSSYIKE